MRNGVITVNVTITAFAKSIKQPKGGFLPVNLFKETRYDEYMNDLYPDENVSKSLIGTTVDNLTRVLLGVKPKEVYEPAIFGMMAVKDNNSYLISRAIDLDDEAIVAAYQLSFYEQIYRSGRKPPRGFKLELPDKHTIENIRVMINRSTNYFKQQKSIINSGEMLSMRCRSGSIYGDYDYLTEDSLIDMKVLSKKITSAHTLQIVLYWLAGTTSKKKGFDNVKYLKFYNPRLNVEYSLDLDKLTLDILNPISYEVLMF